MRVLVLALVFSIFPPQRMRHYIVATTLRFDPRLRLMATSHPSTLDA